MHPLILLLLADTPRPGGPGTRAPDRDWDLQHLHLDLRLLPEQERIEGHAVLRVAPLSPPSPTLRLDQLGLEVRAVQVDGQPVPFTVEPGALTVTLDPSRGAQELRVDYAASPQEGLYFRNPGPDTPDTYPELWTQGEGEDNRHWIPLPDHPGDRFTSSGRFVAPPGWAVLSNGVGAQEGEAWTWRMDQELVSYLVALAAAPYVRPELPSWRGRPVELYLPPDADRAQALTVAQKLPQMLDFFTEVTGVEYPYPAYREVYVQRYMFGAMENTTLTILSRHLLGLPGAPPLGEHPEEVSAHEAVHHWFGDLITCRHWTELWLNEGFAEFYAWEWVRRSLGEGVWARRQVDMTRWAAQAGPLSGRFWSTPDASHRDSSGVYVKGARVLYALRSLLGEDTFNLGIRRYVADNRDRLVDTEDLRRAFEAVSGDDLRWFFDQWAHSPAPPELEASGRWADGTYTLRLRQKLREGQAPYTLHLDVELGGPTPLRRRVWVDQEQVSLVLPLDAAPAWVAIDPEGALPLLVSFEQPAAAWLAQLDSAAPVARVRALRALGSLPPEPAGLEALGALLQSEDAAWAAEAAGALGRWGTPEAQALLVAALAPARDLQVRIAAAGALAERPLGPEGVAALRRLLGAPEARLRARALRSLRVHDRAGALAAARKAARPARGASPVWTDAALDVLAQSGEADDLALVLPWIRRNTPDTLIFTAMDAAVRLAQRAPTDARERARAQLARALEPLLSSEDIRVRRAALRHLGEVGDEQSQRVIAAWALTQHEPEAREQAADTLRTLREAQPDVPEEEALGQARLEELEERLEALESELEALQERR